MITSLVGGGTIGELLNVARTCPKGPIVEVGVYQGGSALYLAELAEELGVELWLYDTFSGMPYQGENDPHKVGDFSDTSLEMVRARIPNAHIVGGIFPGSAMEPGNHPRQPISFVHLDCDQEQSYREAIEFLQPRMAQGGAMWFDDAPVLLGARIAVEGAFGASLRKSDSGNQCWVRCV